MGLDRMIWNCQSWSKLSYSFKSTIITKFLHFTFSLFLSASPLFPYSLLVLQCLPLLASVPIPAMGTAPGKVSMELGGNAPFLVFDDADLDVALRALIAAKFRNAGQACIASNRVLVQAGVYDKFSEMVAEAASAIPCVAATPPSSSSSSTAATATAGATPFGVVGPLIDGRALEKVGLHVEDCVRKGARVVAGGSAHAELNAAGGSFYLPTVLTGVTREMLPYQQETFGPIVPLIKFHTEDEAVAMANDTE